MNAKHVEFDLYLFNILDLQSLLPPPPVPSLIVLLCTVLNVQWKLRCQLKASPDNW